MLYFYTDAIGQKRGPIDDVQLKSLAAQGIITPHTPLETEAGIKGLAGQISGLEFHSITAPPLSGSRDATNLSETGSQEMSTFVQADKPAIVPEVSGWDSSRPSRAVFIFLAVFVGLFGVHDFYAKRIRYGWIHLSLLLPWILFFLVSVFVVFGYSLYAWSYSPYRKEIRECRLALKTNKQEIMETEQKLAELRRKLDEARAGTIRKPKEILPEGKKPREIIPNKEKPEKNTPEKKPREVVPEQDREPRTVIPKPQAEIDLELVQELENSLRELERSLNGLERRNTELQATLASLKIQQGAEKLPAWLSTGPLWLYFFFFILPLASWVMAMFEIIYVTKDGKDREFCF